MRSLDQGRQSPERILRLRAAAARRIDRSTFIQILHSFRSSNIEEI